LPIGCDVAIIEGNNEFGNRPNERIGFGILHLINASAVQVGGNLA
jgi:hypothetical protein